MGGKILEYEHDRILKQGEGIGEAKKTISSIEAIMENLNVTFERACAVLGITESDYNTAKKLLSGYNQ